MLSCANPIAMGVTLIVCVSALIMSSSQLTTIVEELNKELSPSEVEKLTRPVVDTAGNRLASQIHGTAQKVVPE